MPSIRSWLFCFDGLSFSLESCSTVTLAAHQRSPAGGARELLPDRAQRLGGRVRVRAERPTLRRILESRTRIRLGGGHHVQ